MGRNVVVGGFLVSVSLVLAMLLNSYASLEAMQIDSATPAAESNASPPEELQVEPAAVAVASPVLEETADVAEVVRPSVGAAIQTATSVSAPLPN